MFLNNPNLTRVYYQVVCELTETQVEHSPGLFATLKEFECYFDENLVLNNMDLFADTHI